MEALRVPTYLKNDRPFVVPTDAKVGWNMDILMITRRMERLISTDRRSGREETSALVWCRRGSLHSADV